MLTNFRTTLSQKTQLTTDVYLYHFDLLEPKEIIFEAGQYMMLKVPKDDGFVSRLYSIFSSNKVRNKIEFIIEIIPGGLASQYFLSLNINDKVSFQGPAGQFTLKENDKQKIFLVTGTGIAPVRSMLKNYQLSIINYQLFWGLKTYKDVYLFDELKEFNPKICLSREQNLDMISENDRKYFELGHINQCLEKQLTNFDFYLCGRREIVESLRLFLINKGVLPENIMFEKF